MHVKIVVILLLILTGCANTTWPGMAGNGRIQAKSNLTGFVETGRYNKWFRDYTQFHLPSSISPRWPKAVALAESNLKVNAKSSAGALGLMQMLPSTWAWIAPEPWKSAGPMDPEAAIWVGCYFLRWNWNRIIGPDIVQRKAMSNSAYNSGIGWLIKARNNCHTPCDRNIWYENVENCLVTRIDAQIENKNYVKRIKKFEQQLLILNEFI